MRKHQRSTRIRILVPLFIGFFVMSLAFVLISYFTFRAYTIKDCVSYAYGLNSLIADEMDIEKIDDYIREGRDFPGYSDIEAHLYRLRDAYPDIRYLYVYQIQEDGCHVVFDLETPEVPANQPGELMDFDAGFKDRISDLLAGKEIKPFISNDSYGYLLTIYTPQYDSQGTCKCYVGVDYNMDLLVAFVRTIIRQIIFFFLIVVLVIALVSVVLTDRGIVRPMKLLERRAYRDSLTGLQNHAAYDDCAQALDRRILEGKADFSILMADVNYLKRVNDTCGHEKGDEYLKNAADLIAHSFGPDRVYRTGGDEFVCVLEGDAQKDAPRMMGWFRDAMRALGENDNLKPWQKISAAAGIARYESGRDKSAEDVLKRADKAMYEDKLAMKAQRRD